MTEQVDIFLIDEEGILIRTHVDQWEYWYEGEPEDLESPLMIALGIFYHENAPKTLVCRGYKTPGGKLLWQSESATPYGDDDHIEIGERIYLVDKHYVRFSDDHAYAMLAEGQIPNGWKMLPPVDDYYDDEPDEE